MDALDKIVDISTFSAAFAKALLMSPAEAAARERKERTIAQIAAVSLWNREQTETMLEKIYEKYRHSPYDVLDLLKAGAIFDENGEMVHQPLIF